MLKVDKAEAEQTARDNLTKVGLGDRRRLSGALSGGQQQRVAIAGLSMNPELMFRRADVALDPELVGDVLSVCAIWPSRA